MSARQSAADRPQRLEAGFSAEKGCCERCGKPLREVVALELDQRINEYHDFGDVPVESSQGWFNFGPDCAKVLRARARKAFNVR